MNSTYEKIINIELKIDGYFNFHFKFDLFYGCHYILMKIIDLHCITFDYKMSLLI